ncbi:hypothetical protein, partial [uncultured Desulfovibrio sp.]
KIFFALARKWTIFGGSVLTYMTDKNRPVTRPKAARSAVPVRAKRGTGIVRNASGQRKKGCF